MGDTAEKQQKVPGKPFEKGDERINKNGRPAGQRNYATIYKEALAKIAEAKDMTSQEIEDMLIETGLGKALEGDFKFYKDIQDRIHGQPAQSIDLKAEIVKPLIKLDE